MKNKFSFHVSTMPAFWEEGLEKRYIAEPYVAHYYRLSESKDTVIAEFSRKNKLDYELTSNYLALKVKRYRTQLCLDLNTLHQVDYSEEFWIKAIGLGFVRFVHMLYDGYQIASQFNPEEHQAYVLDEASYYICQDFEDFRQLFQHSNFGFEQMFSLYIKTFHLEVYKSNTLLAKCDFNDKVDSAVIKSSLINRFKNITFSKVIKNMSLNLLKLRKPKVGIFHSYFSYENMQKLIFKSFGEINNVQFNLKQIGNNKINDQQRKTLTKNIIIKDDFDIFFKAAIESFFPTLYVESFTNQISLFEKEASKYKELKYLVSEGWIGDSRMCLFIAALQKQGTIHIYNEHNFLQHFILGNQVEQIMQMCDQYYTLGWDEGFDLKIKKGASLFPFSIENSVNKKSIKYLYIGCIPFVKMPEINCAYGEQEENATRYITSLQLFFNSLSNDVKKNLVYRPYPSRSNWLTYDLKQVTAPFVSELKAIDDYKHTAKNQMLKARLVIVDYLSTSYLEALIMNVPLIILFDSSRYFLKDSHKNFFDALIHAGICHKNESLAANFINKMGEGIESWWKTKKVQDARTQFLNANIGNPDNAIKYYLSLVNKKFNHF